MTIILATLFLALVFALLGERRNKRQWPPDDFAAGKGYWRLAAVMTFGALIGTMVKVL